MMQVADFEPLALTKSRLAELAQQVVEGGWKIYYDVSTLFEEHWTGIPMVAAGLGRALLDLLPANTVFFHRNSIVATDSVADAFARESGLYLERDYQTGRARVGLIQLPDNGQPSAGIFPSVKQVRALFSVECSIYHDISTLLLPQFHTVENVRHHMASLTDDIRTNTITFGVSQATIEDLVCYLDAPTDRTAVARNGVSWPWWFPVELENDPPSTIEGPYFLILGTREPRKNLVRVFEALELFPEILERSRFVFVGRSGWLTELQTVPDMIQEMIDQKRIVFTGYVSNFEKYRLLAGAEATIYPSLFEGFGLPVLESLSVGTPCISSWSSALPEVGGDACLYFDPLSAEELGLMIKKVQIANPRGTPGYLDLCRSVSAMFTWPGMLETVLSHLVPALTAADQRFVEPVRPRQLRSSGQKRARDKRLK